MLKRIVITLFLISFVILVIYWLYQTNFFSEEENLIGTIEGSLSYPSEFIPPDMKVCAENIATEKIYCTEEHIKDNKYTYGEGYNLDLPVGSYYVYAEVKMLEDYKAYYSEFIACGLNTDCSSHEPIVVTVEASQTTKNIDPQDWYSKKDHSAGKETICENLLSSQAFVEQYDFSLKEKYQGSIAEVNFNDERWPNASMFRTKINEAVSNGPNFAGHYTVAMWGCGSSCQQAAVIDVKTGEIVYFGLGATEGISFSIESTVLITNPKRDISSFSTDKDRQDYMYYAASFPREYYHIREIEGGQNFLQKICLESGADGYNSEIKTQEEISQAECQEYDIDECPDSCTVCPPCAACSSLGCNSTQFCNSIGFDKSWYEMIKTQR